MSFFFLPNKYSKIENLSIELNFELVIDLNQVGFESSQIKNFLTYFKQFCFCYIALFCLFETFPCGWVVVKSDFNENPVISLDLDFWLPLTVYQFPFTGTGTHCSTRFIFVLVLTLSGVTPQQINIWQRTWLTLFESPCWRFLSTFW